MSGRRNGLRRSSERTVFVCHWCKTSLISFSAKTDPAFSSWPGLPPGTGVVVCGASCPERPDGAPVGSRFGD